MFVTGLNRGEAQALCLALNRLLGLPRRGVHVGRGGHADIPEAWDGVGEAPLGWTAPLTPTRRRVAWEEYVVVVRPEALAKATQAEHRARLTDTDRDVLALQFGRVATRLPAEVELDFEIDAPRIVEGGGSVSPTERR